MRRREEVSNSCKLYLERRLNAMDDINVGKNFLDMGVLEMKEIILRDCQ